MAWQLGQGAVGFGAARCGQARQGQARQSRLGNAWLGMARHGKARQFWRGWRGRDRQGGPRLGMAVKVWTLVHGSC